MQLFRQIAPDENPSLETNAETLRTVKLIGRMDILVSGAEGEKNCIGTKHLAKSCRDDC